MQNLLNPDSGIRLAGFDGEWMEKTLGDLFSFGSSLTSSRDQLGVKGIPYLHYGDIHANDDYYVDLDEDYMKIPKLDCSNVPYKQLLKDGDVVFVDASEDYEGTSKFAVIINISNKDFIAGLHTIPAHSKNDELTKLYKRYCFQNNIVKKQIAFYATGMKVIGLNKDNIAKIILIYPSDIKEQIAIAGILSTVDKEIKLLNNELAEWHIKRKSLMQLLLTGIVRVKI